MSIVALFTIARIQKQPICPLTDEWMKKMWCIYTMEHYSSMQRRKKWVICSDVDGPKGCHTQWSKSERKIQILYINVCVYIYIYIVHRVVKSWTWNLERWCRCDYFQGRNRDSDVENGHVDTVGEGWGGKNQERSIGSPTCMKQIASWNLLYNTGSSAWCSVMT